MSRMTHNILWNIPPYMLKLEKIPHKIVSRGEHCYEYE